MTPQIPKSKECIAFEEHVKTCPICQVAMDGAESAICDEGFRLVQEAVKKAKKEGGERE